MALRYLGLEYYKLHFWDIVEWDDMMIRGGHGRQCGNIGDIESKVYAADYGRVLNQDLALQATFSRIGLTSSLIGGPKKQDSSFGWAIRKRIFWRLKSNFMEGRIRMFAIHNSKRNNWKMKESPIAIEARSAMM